MYINRKLISTFAVLLTLVVIIALSYAYSMKWDNAFIIKPIARLQTTKKVVALTFDDGPSNKRTLPLLNTLEKYDVKATFFMLGKNIEKYPEIAKKVYNNGNMIGNHSYNHPKLVFKTPQFIISQIERTDELIKNLGPNDVKYFRPPYSSKYLLLPIILKLMDKKLVTGTYDPPSEYKNPLNSNDIANDIISNIRPGSIIYLHDGKDDDVDEFCKAVDLVISRLMEDGYEFMKIDYMDNN